MVNKTNEIVKTDNLVDRNKAEQLELEKKEKRRQMIENAKRKKMKDREARNLPWLEDGDWKNLNILITNNKKKNVHDKFQNRFEQYKDIAK